MFIKNSEYAHNMFKKLYQIFGAKYFSWKYNQIIFHYLYKKKY